MRFQYTTDSVPRFASMPEGSDGSVPWSNCTCTEKKIAGRAKVCVYFCASGCKHKRSLTFCTQESAAVTISPPTTPRHPLSPLPPSGKHLTHRHPEENTCPGMLSEQHTYAWRHVFSWNHQRAERRHFLRTKNFPPFSRLIREKTFIPSFTGLAGKNGGEEGGLCAKWGWEGLGE